MLKKPQKSEILLIVAGALIFGIGTRCFIVPANIAPGGASGIALMLNYTFGLPVGMLTFGINIPLLFLAWNYINKEFAIKTAAACIICSFVLDVIITPFFPLYTGDRLLCSLFGGVLSGIGMGSIFLAGCTTGGSDIVGRLLQLKYPHISIGKALMLVDGILLTASIFVFQNIEAGLFGLISLFVQIKIIDGMIYGIDTGSMVTIVTANSDAIAQSIIGELGRSATILKGRGAYSQCENEVLLCVVRKSQFAALKKIIWRADPQAFMMVTETTEVFGEGFKEIPKIHKSA